MSDRQLIIAPEGPEHFGAYLAQARIGAGYSLPDISLKTKIPEHQLRRIEAADFDELPAEVFVRGFVRAYAKTVGASPEEALRRLDEALAERQRNTRRQVSLLGVEANSQDAEGMGRRRYGVALVLLLLVMATLAASLLLRRPVPSVGGISLAPILERSAPPARETV